jgi:hypothetical protein
MTTIASPWSLSMGNGFVVTILQAPGRRQFILVDVEYFTKWMESKAMAEITTSKVTYFLWKNIICMFGLSWVLITYNDTQFDNKM